MPQFKYLIVGGGMTAASAAQGIREIDQQGAIGMITAESRPPYDDRSSRRGSGRESRSRRSFATSRSSTSIF